VVLLATASTGTSTSTSAVTVSVLLLVCVYCDAPAALSALRKWQVLHPPRNSEQLTVIRVLYFACQLERWRCVPREEACDAVLYL
jgi:hypothetical protein